MARTDETLASIIKKPAVRFALLLGAALLFAVLGVAKIGQTPQAAVPATTPLPVGDGHLRFDGLYRDASGGGKLALCLRFYATGDVLAVISANADAQVASSLYLQHERSLHGRYQVQGNAVTFTFLAPDGLIDLEAAIGEDQLVLYFYNHGTGRSATGKFDFHPVSFLTE